MKFKVENRHYGLIILSLTLTFVLYYTVWVIVLPFVDEEYLPYISSFFPPLYLAFSLPLGIGFMITAFLFLRAYYLVIEDRKNEAKQK